MPRFVRIRLSAMMFIFYFGLGAWMVTLSSYLMTPALRGGLSFTTEQVGITYSAFAFGGMIAPLIVGLISDHFFRSERALAIVSITSSILLVIAARWCDIRFPEIETAARIATEFAQSEGNYDLSSEDAFLRRVVAETFRPLFLIMLGYSILAQLSITLTTVVTLRNLPDPVHEFSRIRLFGTIGWIASGNVVGCFLRPTSSDILYLAALGAGLVGIYALTLPPTRPRGKGRSIAEIAGLPALKLFRDHSFIVFVGVAFAATAMNQFYVVYGHPYLSALGLARPVQYMTIAQVVEVGCMFALPLLRPKDWMKYLMLLGLVGYSLRAVIMAIGWLPAVVAVGVPMHGWGYAFFFLVGATYLDREAPGHLRASAQGIITFVSGGVGTWFGNMIAGAVVDRNRLGTAIDWQSVWLVPLVACAVIATLFALFFRTPSIKTILPPIEDDLEAPELRELTPNAIEG